MDLTVDLSERGDRSAALYRALRDAIRDGRLGPGDRLPASRTLAGDVGVARSTVAGVYERLVAEGFLEARVGAGTFVSAVAPEPRTRPEGALLPRPSWVWGVHPVSGEQATPAYDFRVGIPDAALFPFDTWRRLLAAESRHREHNPGTYAPPGGMPRLREAIARAVGYSRGVRADPDDVVVTSGAQHAINLAARVLVEPGDVVAVEDPGAPFVRDLFASYGARVVPVPVDEQGLVVSQVPTDARIVYTTPSHQFPLGVALPLARRRELLDHAARHGAAIIEDDYDSKFRFSARPLETLHSLDEAGRVLYVGTFSKSLIPSLRTGYLVTPPSLRDALLAARQLDDGYGPLHLQAALARFLEEGLLARHVRKAAKVYAARRDLLLAGLSDLPLEVVPSTAGLHLAAFLPDGAPPWAGDEIASRAWEHGIGVEPLATYTVEPHRPGLVFGYGAAVTESIRPGLRVLGRLLADGSGSTRGPRPPGRAAAAPAAR